MPRFLRTEDALAWVRSQARVTAAGMARGLDATPAAAASLLARLEASGIIGPAGPDGAHPVLGERRRRWEAPPRPDTPDPWAETARLRTETEAALRRAEAAEARLAEAVTGSERLDRLRRMLARELHPDTAAPAEDPALQAACAEVFKRVWPRIEAILAGEAES